jgi:hypothetical protein
LVLYRLLVLTLLPATSEPAYLGPRIGYVGPRKRSSIRTTIGEAGLWTVPRLTALWTRPALTIATSFRMEGAGLPTLPTGTIPTILI